MSTLQELEPGDRVGYISFGKPVEFGIISSKNDKYVFVRFDQYVKKFGWDGATSQACDPSDLELIEHYPRNRIYSR